ncbi:hypothetical protein WR25_16587 [Diploscapter pachys]|uniref:26S proteasome non-ATPase regulatory subunit 8 n=1 Tax=Diploscapter pachys TaxID=2018661 RepID=A0A2A2LAI8_9BILA|nr:hypothetical protein WR25_16587 [Diploscapter pachys]
MASLQQLHTQLLSEWKGQKVDSVIKILTQMATALHDKQALSAMDLNALNVILKDFHEISALSSIVKGDIEAFNNAVQQALTLYEICPAHAENKYLMIGLYLMYLLSSNKLSDFHMVLERVPHKEHSANPYICTPVRLEHSLMEGAYNKVVLTEKNIPSPYYSIFINIMVSAVRRNIAESIEKSFKMLTVKDAQTMLLFDKEPALLDFAKQRQWRVDGGCFMFEVEAAKPDKVKLDTTQIAEKAIFYAKQLEQII